MTSRPSRFPAAAQRRQLPKVGSRSVVMIAGSLLFAAAVFFQPPAHSAETTFAGLAAEAGMARSSGTVAKIAVLEKGFWVCDYLGTTRGVEGSYGVTCGANFEELKATKFGGDFDALVQWWRVDKAAQHKALESVGSAQY